MDILAGSKAGKIAADLSKGAIMDSTSKFVKTTGQPSTTEKLKLQGYGWGARNRKQLSKPANQVTPIKNIEIQSINAGNQEQKKGKFQRSSKKVTDDSQNTKSTSLLGNQGIETPRGSQVSGRRGLISRKTQNQVKTPRNSQISSPIQADPVPVQESVKPRYGARNTNKGVNNNASQQQAAKNVQPPPRYGRKSLNQTEKVEEQKNIQTSNPPPVSRYGRKPATQPIQLPKKQMSIQQPVKPTPPPSRYGRRPANQITQQAQPKKEQAVEPSLPVQPASRYGRRPQVNQTKEQQTKKEETPQPTPSRYNKTSHPSHPPSVLQEIQSQVIPPAPSPPTKAPINRYARKPAQQKQQEQMKPSNPTTTPQKQVLKPTAETKPVELKPQNPPTSRYGRKPAVQQPKPSQQKQPQAPKPPQQRYGRKPATQSIVKAQEQSNNKQGQQFEPIPNSLVENIIRPVKKQGRYGAERSPRTPRHSQIDQNQKKQDQSKIKPQQKPQSKTPVSRYDRRSAATTPQGSEIGNSRIQQSKISNNRQEEGNKSPTPSNISQSRLKGNSSASQPQLLSKQQQQQQLDACQVKKSSIFGYILHNIFKEKASSHLKSIQIYSKLKKIQQTNMITLSWKLSELSKRKQIQYNQQFLSILRHPYPQTSQSTIKKPPVQAKGTSISLQDKMKGILPNIIHRLSVLKQKQTFAKINAFKPASRDSTKISISLHSLYKEKTGQIFRGIKHKSQSKKLLRFLSISSIANIMGKVHKENQRKVVVQLLKNMVGSLTIDNVSSPQKQSKIQDLSPIKAVSEISQTKSPSPSKNIQNIQKQCNENSKILQQLKQTNENDKIQAREKLQMAQNACSQISQHIQYKKRVNEELKVKIQSINIPQENYISEDEPISQTKFPLMAEIYMKIEKMGSNISLSEIKQLFPFLFEDFTDNLSTQKWHQILRTIKLKRQIDRYEGGQILKRKAARQLQKEIQGLQGIVRGYIREKFAWEWVKSALTNVSVVSS